MKKFILSLIFFVCWVTICCAQGTLQFNAAKIVTNTLQTVPGNKVWKVTAIYGSDYICIPSAYPKYVSNSSTYGNPGYYVAYTGSGMVVNGFDILSFRTWSMYNTSAINVFDNTACTGSSVTSTQGRGWGAYDVTANPNILPQWLPAGTTVKTYSANVLISVIEFNIIP